MISPLVSVIVPLYNRRHYVQQSVDSALNPGFEDYEIIILDNKSTDGGYELCQELYGSNPKVKLLRHDFQCGLGASRNFGISLARGKYIAFLDSDDVYVGGGLKKMLEIAEATNAEVVHSIGWLQSTDDGGSTIKPDSKLVIGGISSLGIKTLSGLTSDIKMRMDMFLDRKINIMNAWSKIYLRDYLLEKSITFPDTLNEDVSFLILNLLHARQYVIAPIFWNIYRISSDSLSFSVQDSQFLSKVIDSIMLGVKHLDESFKKSEFIINNPVYGDMLRERVITQLLDFNLFRRGLYGICPLNELKNISDQTLSKFISDETLLKIFSSIFNHMGVYQAKFNQIVLENRVLTQRIEAAR